MTDNYSLSSPPKYIDGWRMIGHTLDFKEQTWESPCGAIVTFSEATKPFHPETAQKTIDEYWLAQKAG